MDIVKFVNLLQSYPQWFKLLVAVWLIVTAFLGIGLFMLRPTENPFNVGIRSAIITELNTEPITFLMAGYSSSHGRTVSPISHLLHLQIVNLQNIPNTIEGYSVSVSDNETGPWDNLLPISLLSSTLYFLGASNSGGNTLVIPKGTYLTNAPMTQEAMTHAAPIKPYPDFDSELGKPIPPHHTVGGWAAFALQDRSKAKARHYVRITIRDSTNKSYTSVVPFPSAQQGEADPQAGHIPSAGPIVDISSYHVRNYRAP